jgi:SH3-like domain-containing protein
MSVVHSRNSAAVPAPLRNATIAVVLLAIAGGGAGIYWGMKTPAAPETLFPGEVTGSTDEMPVEKGPSGLPLPRFVTLKAAKVNVRKGPSHDHAIAWIYQRKGLPIEITAESDNWRKIRDAEGQEGWIQQSMLTGKRNALVARWAKNGGVLLHDKSNPNSGAVARLAPGVVATVDSCDGEWCYLNAGGYEGYAQQSELWGVYPGEVVD